MYIAHRIDELWVEGKIREVVHVLSGLPKERRREVAEEVLSYRAGRKDREKFEAEVMIMVS